MGSRIWPTLAMGFAMVCVVGVVLSESDLLINGSISRGLFDGFLAEAFFLGFTVTTVLWWSSGRQASRGS